MRPAAASCLFFLLASWGAAVFAQGATVSHLSGTLSVKKADGSVRLLSQKSRIEPGDTIATERDSFAQIEFADGARLTLKPGTAVTLERFSYAEERPEEDAFFYSVLRGGVRAVAGIVGERSSERYQVRTAGGTVGIRPAAAAASSDGAVRVGRRDADARPHAATFTIDDCTSSRGGECARLQAAVFVAVADGEAVARNPQGEVGLAAGQAGALAAGERPLFLGDDPGLQFTPPASFIQSIMTGALVNLGRSAECAVAR
jgi:hypothetical protein